MEAITARMGLGGAQFGMRYGVTSQGRPDPLAVRRILSRAQKAGVRFLDTAPAYGDSEETIGSSDLSSRFRIVSKTPKDLGSISEAAMHDRLDRSIELSLSRLNVPKLDAILVHDASDLLHDGGRSLWTVLERLRKEGWCERIGVSVYRGEEIDRIVERFPVDLVQVPYNVLDQRLVDGGQFDRLASAGIAVHVRSVFLQGLLLAPHNAIPASFAPIARAVREFEAWAEGHGMTRLQAIIADVLQRPGVECCLFGTHSVDELQSILDAAEAAAHGEWPQPFDLANPLDDQMLDPSRWSELA